MSTDTQSRVFLQLSPVSSNKPGGSPFPAYVDEPELVSSWVWKIGQVIAIGAALFVVVLLFIDPHAGLITWWLFILPTLPMVWLLAPGIWRNVCPMATINQIPRNLKIGLNLKVPPRLLKHAYLFQFVFYFAAISTRAPLLDHSGPALGGLMIIALVAPLVGGFFFAGKSGWCGTFCPLLPVQKLYGQTPAVVVKNAHCSSCVGCVKNCYDFNPRVAAVADMHDDDKLSVSYRKIFAGTFPGFVVAFFTIPQAQVGQPVDVTLHLAAFYGLTGLAMLISLGAFYLIESLLPKVSPTVIVAGFGALALNLHNILRFTTTWNVHKPMWLRVLEGSAVCAVTVWFVYRTWRQEKRVFEESDRGTLGLPTRPVPAGASIQECNVSFDDKAVVSVPSGTTLLDAAERAGAEIATGCRSGVCGSDPVFVRSGAACLSECSEREQATLSRLGLDRPGVRLACVTQASGSVDVQTKVSKIDLPGPPPVEDVQRVLIIGNGAAGSTVAEHVSRLDPTISIRMVAAEARAFYNRMAITGLIHNTSGTAGLAMQPDDWNRATGVDTMLNTQAVEIDRAQRHLLLGTGEALEYDSLVLAMGSRPVRPTLPGNNLPGVFVLRTADDAVLIRAYAQQHRCRRAVVLGAGLLGLEAAHGLQQLGLHTSVVASGPRLLRRQLDERGSELLGLHLAELGIELLCGAAEVVGDERAEGLRLNDGTCVPLDMLVMCIGSTPRTELAEQAGLDVASGVVVDDHMRTSDERIFAVGDVAEHRGQVAGLWTVATEQAEIAAQNVAGSEVAWSASTEFPAMLKDVGLDVLSIGRVTPASGDEVIVDESPAERIYRKLVLDDGQLVGGVVMGQPGLASAVASAVRDGKRLDRAAVAKICKEPDRIREVLNAASTLADVTRIGGRTVSDIRNAPAPPRTLRDAA
jgi:nitrite reductase (NADH) large subunit